MLQITEPRQIRVESHRGVIDSNAMTKEAFAPDLEDEYRLAPSEPEFTDANDESPVAAPPRADTSPAFEEAFYENSLNAPPLPEAAAKSAHTAYSPAAIQQLAVQRKAKNRQVLMIAVLGLSGVLVAGLLFTVFLFWYSGDRAATPLAQKQNDAASNPPPKREPESGEDSSMEEPAELASEQPDAPESDSTAKPEIDAQNNASADNQTENKTGNDPSMPADGANDLTSAIANAIANPNNAAEQPNAPENNGSVNADGTAAEANPATTAELPEQLKKFENILNRRIEPQMIADEVIQKTPPTAEELGLQVGADSKALPPIDVGTQLNLEISGLIVPDSTPFSAAVSTWVQLSGVPTGVDLDSFAAAGVDPFKKIGVKEATAKTLGDVGKTLATAIGVDLIGMNNQFLVFQASEARVKEQLGESIKVDDLIKDAEQEKWLLATLEQLIPHADTAAGASAWKIETGTVKADPAAVNTLGWFWTVRLLESWRSAAKLESQLTGLQPAAFVTHFIDPQQIASLEQPMKFAQFERGSVAQLIANVSAANNMHTWIDWAATSQRGLGPNTIDFFVTQSRTMRQVMKDLSSKYGVVVAVENERSLIITTSQEYLAQPRLYVLPSEGKTAEQWIAELEPLTPAMVGNVQPVRAILTPDSQYVIVRCCRPRLRN